MKNNVDYAPCPICGRRTLISQWERDNDSCGICLQRDGSLRPYQRHKLEWPPQTKETSR